MIVLDTEFNSLSNGIRFDKDHRYKKRFILQIPGTTLVNLVPIRSATCVESENDCVRRRIKFSIE